MQSVTGIVVRAAGQASENLQPMQIAAFSQNYLFIDISGRDSLRSVEDI
jgi:hypothetical protein